MDSERQRWAVFGLSVVSAVENPDAYLLRALGRVLVDQGQSATFFEERGNPPVRALLHRSGGRALTDFNARYPSMHYRTVEPLSGPALVEWLTRTLATVDIALVQRQAPADLVGWVGKLTRPHLQTYLVDTGLTDSPSELALDTRAPGHFSGVFVASEQLAELYAPLVAPERLHRFGPLPSPAQLAELSEPAMRELDVAARELVERILRAARRDRGAGIGQGAAGGSTM